MSNLRTSQTQNPPSNNPKYVSLKYLNQILQLPQIYPLVQTIQKIKGLISFKKEHVECRNQLARIKTEIQNLNHTIQELQIKDFARCMRRSIQSVDQIAAFQSHNTMQNMAVHTEGKDGQNTSKLKARMSRQIVQEPYNYVGSGVSKKYHYGKQCFKQNQQLPETSEKQGKVDDQADLNNLDVQQSLPGGVGVTTQKTRAQNKESHELMTAQF